MRRIGILIILSFLISSQLGVVLAQTDQGTIVVTGTVPPSPTSINISINVVPISTVPQQTDLVYTITYGSANTAAVPVTLQAHWDKGTIDGAIEPSVNIVEYQVGTASQGYGGAVPIISLLDRTITWNISNLPGGSSNQTITFTLRTTSNYTGQNQVTFPVTASVVSPIGVPDDVVVGTYVYQSGLVAASPTPNPVTSSGGNTNTSGSTNSNSSTASSSANQPSAPTQLASGATSRIVQLAMQSISAKAARIGTRLNNSAQVQLQYGLAPTQLTTTVTSPASTTHLFNVPGLQPETTYYFTVTGPPENEQAVQSDIFSFTTASQAVTSTQPDRQSLIVSQDRAVVYTGQANPDVTMPLVLNRDSIADVTLTVPDSNLVKNIELFIRDPGVLGTSTETVSNDDLQSKNTRLTKVGGDVFVGKLRTPPEAGTYQLISRLEDIYGNIVEEDMGMIVVMRPFTVVSEGTQQPLNGAKVSLSAYNEQTQLFESISNVTTSISNPLETDSNGEVTIALYPGKYRAAVSYPGYHPQEVTFDIQGASSDEFPIVQLKPTIFVSVGWVGDMTNNIRQTITELWTNMQMLNTQAKGYQFAVFLGMIYLGSSLLYLFLITRVKRLRNMTLSAFFSTSNWRESVPETILSLFWQLIEWCFYTLVIFNMIWGILILGTPNWLAGIVVIALAIFTMIVVNRTGARIISYSHSQELLKK